MPNTLNRCDQCEELVPEELTEDVWGHGSYYCDPCHDQDVEDSQEWESFVHDHRRGGWTTG